MRYGSAPRVPRRASTRLHNPQHLSRKALCALLLETCSVLCVSKISTKCAKMDTARVPGVCSSTATMQNANTQDGCHTALVSNKARGAMKEAAVGQMQVGRDTRYRCDKPLPPPSPLARTPRRRPARHVLLVLGHPVLPRYAPPCRRRRRDPFAPRSRYHPRAVFPIALCPAFLTSCV